MAGSVDGLIRKRNRYEPSHPNQNSEAVGHA